MTEQILQGLKIIGEQLARGNERFQRIDSELLLLRQRLDGHDRRLDKEIPDAMAVLRSDMLRAFGSVMEKSKENIETALTPIKAEMKPITEVVSKTHSMITSLVKWGLVSLGGIVIAVLTAYLLRWFSL